ncbi:MAG: tail fiber domain-containing protein, partial [Planctomycetes bacterium]|nr:tail fiber domain-containing protein [Planctomycetota bacterium]
GADTTNLVGLFGDPDFARVEVGDGNDPDSGVVVQSAVERKNHGHVTVLKIANGGADTTNLVGLFGDPDFASVEVGDGTDPDSGVVVQSAVDHKHHGHVTILKIAGGGADTTEIVNISGDADSASIQLNGGGGAGGTILLEADESTSSGRIGVNTLSPAYEIDVVGTICATGGMCRQSDSRLKENVEPLSGAISLIQSLEPVRYNWRHEEYPDRRFPDGNQMGFIAQEVREVLPELVSQGSDGFYSLDYAKLTPILVGALKQQQQVIEGLQKQVAETRYTNEQMQGLQLQVNQMQTLIHTLMSDQQDSRESNADLTASR